MLEQSSQKILAALLSKCVQNEKQIERSRISLCEKHDFSTPCFFSLITSSDSISSRDLKTFLLKHNLKLTDSEIYMTIKQYSYLQNGRLSLSDFNQLLLPSTDHSLRDICLSRSIAASYSEYTLCCLLRVFQEELKLQGELEEIKIELYKKSDFSVYKAFDCLAQGKQGINERDFLEFMRSNMKIVAAEDFEALLRRVDLEGDGVVSYNEFLEFIVPFDIPEKHNRDSQVKKEERIIEELLLEAILAIRREEFEKNELEKIKGVGLSEIERMLKDREFICNVSGAEQWIKENEVGVDMIRKCLIKEEAEESSKESKEINWAGRRVLKDALEAVILTDKKIDELKYKWADWRNADEIRSKVNLIGLELTENDLEIVLLRINSL